MSSHRMLTADEQEEVLADLRWYGKTIAGGGPMGGYTKAAQRAEAHWYGITLPLLEKLNAVYAAAPSSPSAIRCVHDVPEGLTCAICGPIKTDDPPDAAAKADNEAHPGYDCGGTCVIHSVGEESKQDAANADSQS